MLLSIHRTIYPGYHLTNSKPTLVYEPPIDKLPIIVWVSQVWVWNSSSHSCSVESGINTWRHNSNQSTYSCDYTPVFAAAARGVSGLCMSAPNV